MKRFAIGLALALGVGASIPVAAEDTAASVMACMRASVPPTLRVRDIELTTTSKDGASETLKGKLYAMREAREGEVGPLRVMLSIQAPPKLAGAAYLVRQSDDYLSDGMYVFLPSVKRVRRVTGTFADGSLLGSNFSYSDFKQLESAFADAEAVLESPAEFDFRKLHVLRILPRKAPPGTAAASRFSSVRLWVDMQTCVPLQGTFFEKENARKRLTIPANALRQSGQYWYPSVMEMENLRDGSKSVLKVLDVRAGEKVPAGYFDPKLFYLGR